MVINSRLLLALAFLSLFSLQVVSQEAIQNLDPPASEYPYWIEWMQDENVNFYDVQAAFEAYWENRKVTKGSGWKPFKRWEWWTERHINEDGSRHGADKVYSEYNKYLELNPTAKDEDGDWTNLGPTGVPSKGYAGLGRINAVAFHPTDEDIVYIGAPAGGCWRYDGVSGEWYSTTDELPTLGVSSIVVDWNDPDRIYIGTGDRDAGDAVGLGVFKSEDEGETWEQCNTGMGNKTVGRMIQHPDDEDIIYAATNGGIYKTTDAGDNWEQIKTGNYKDIVFRPDDPSTIYAAGGSYAVRSEDDGETWETLNNGISSGTRSVIAVSEDDSDYLYVLLCNSSDFKGIWRSTDGGDSFTNMSTSPNIMSWGCTGGSSGQAWYDLDVAVDPEDKDVVYAGGVNCFKSIDGGDTWDISSHWWGDCNVPSVHADLHVLEYNPLNNRIYAGNDGGIYYSANGGGTWPEITDGLPISQVYRIGQCAIDADKVINGYQDNGTSTYYGDASDWETTNGGDGMECAFDHTNSAYSYSTIYYGAIYRHLNNGSTHQVGGDGIHGMTEEGGWITPFCLHEGNSDVMFAGLKNIWRADDVKSNSFTWKKLTTTGGGNIDVVEHSPVDYNLFYYARNSSLFRSDNVMEDNPEWITLSTYLPGGGDVFSIEAHPHKADVVYVSKGSNVYVSEDRGFTWEEITGSLPGINMNSLAAYANSIDGLYVGSDAGVYYRDASMTDWTMFSQGLPVDASINEIDIYHNPENPEEDVIRAGTYGRGLWSSPVWHSQPEADFEVDESSVPVGCGLNFYDKSFGVPTSWEWTFEGATPPTSSDQNPEGIIYEEEGVYSVTLTVSNSEGDDTETMTDFIEVIQGATPDVNFIASDSIICSGTEVSFSDLSGNCPTAWQWSFDPATVNYINGTNSTSQNPTVLFSQVQNYSVTLTVENSEGSSELTKEDYINMGGMALPFSDDFESGNLESKSWEVSNPDYNMTWGMATVEGNSPGNQAAFMNFFDYLVPPGPRDQLITPALDFSDMDEIYLSFQHAYAKRHESATDSLIVKISDDCGESWTRIFEGGDDGEGVFATHELTTDFFIPEEPGDWCGAGYGAECTVINLSAWSGSGSMQVMFESYSHFGNNLYLDNILIGPMVDIAENMQDEDVRIFPNPSSGKVNILLPEQSRSYNISIYNLQGQEIINLGNVGGSLQTANLSPYGKGIYFIHLNSERGSIVKKIVLE